MNKLSEAGYTSLYVIEFLSFLTYDAWLLLRDRALQSSFFQTPSKPLLVVYLLIALTASLCVVFLLDPSHPKVDLHVSFYEHN